MQLPHFRLWSALFPIIIYLCGKKGNKLYAMHDSSHSVKWNPLSCQKPQITSFNAIATFHSSMILICIICNICCCFHLTGSGWRDLFGSQSISYTISKTTKFHLSLFTKKNTITKFPLCRNVQFFRDYSAPIELNQKLIQ